MSMLIWPRALPFKRPKHIALARSMNLILTDDVWLGSLVSTAETPFGCNTKLRFPIMFS
jgi:hypothetical protein